MNEKIRQLIKQIQVLEEELVNTIAEQESKAVYRIKGARVEFEQAVRDAHRQLRVNLMTWLRYSHPRNLVSVPFIYGMLIPLALLDLSLLLYQTICFRLYKIPHVKRSNHVVIDRHQLAYLNVIEKINCVYCGYGNGVIAYAREIAARTEQYWCPIKHAKKVGKGHDRYVDFIDYGDAQNYPVKVKDLREALTKDDT